MSPGEDKLRIGRASHNIHRFTAALTVQQLRRVLLVHYTLAFYFGVHLWVVNAQFDAKNQPVRPRLRATSPIDAVQKNLGDFIKAWLPQPPSSASPRSSVSKNLSPSSTHCPGSPQTIRLIIGRSKRAACGFEPFWGKQFTNIS